MITLKGQTVCDGKAYGEIYVIPKKIRTAVRYTPGDTEKEIERFENAQRKAMSQLGEIYMKVNENMGRSEAMIFSTQQMMLWDEDFGGMVCRKISDDKLNAEAAVEETCKEFVAIFKKVSDSYIRERSVDIKDVSQRLINILSDEENVVFDDETPTIISAHMLLPSETAQLNLKNVLAIITEKGSDTSHTAILAKKMNIPMITGVKAAADKKHHGKMAAVDGVCGMVYIEPDEKTLEALWG